MEKPKVYSTPGCLWCHRLKDWMKENNIEFEEVDVSEDQKAAHYIVHKSGQMGVPQTEINGKIIVGFNPAAIEQELNAGKHEKHREAA